MAQRGFVTFCAPQRIQNMYIVIISWAGIGNVAGQHRFNFLCKHRFKVVGKNTDTAVIEQQGECVFYFTGGVIISPVVTSTVSGTLIGG